MASNLGNVYKPRYRIAFLAKSKVWPYKNSRMRRFFNIRGRKLVRKGLFKRIVLVLNKMKWTVSRRYIRPVSRTRRSKKREFKNSFYVKQQLKAFYGFSKEQALRSFFKRYMGGAKTRTGLFLSAIESRLDVFLFRVRFLPTIYACKQFIRYYGIRLNWDLKKKPDTKVRPGDMIVFTSPYWDHFSRSLLVRLYWRNVGLDRFKRRLFLESRYKMLWLRKRSRFYKKNFFLLAKRKRLLWKFLQLVQTLKGFSVKFENKLDDLYLDIVDSSFNFQALVNPLILETEAKRQSWKSFALSYKLMSPSYASDFEKKLALYKDNVRSTLDFYIQDVLNDYRLLQKSFLQNLYYITRKINDNNLNKSKLHTLRSVFRRFKRKRLFRFWRFRTSASSFRSKLASRHLLNQGFSLRRGFRAGVWWGFKAKPLLKVNKTSWAYRKKIGLKVLRKSTYFFNPKVLYKKLYRSSIKFNKTNSNLNDLQLRWNLRLKKRFLKERHDLEVERLTHKAKLKTLRDVKKEGSFQNMSSKANFGKKWYKVSKNRRNRRVLVHSFWKKSPWRWLFIMAKRNEMFLTKFLMDSKKFSKFFLKSKLNLKKSVKVLSSSGNEFKTKSVLASLKRSSNFTSKNKKFKKEVIGLKNTVQPNTFKDNFLNRNKFQKKKNFFTLNKELYWNINSLFFVWLKKKIKNRQKLFQAQKVKKETLLVQTPIKKTPTNKDSKKFFRVNRVQKTTNLLKKIRKTSLTPNATVSYLKKYRIFKLKKKYKYSVSFFLNKLNSIFNAYRFIYFYLNKFFKLESLTYTNIFNIVFTIKNFEDLVFAEPYKLFFKSWLSASHISLTDRRKKVVTLSVWFKKL